MNSTNLSTLIVIISLALVSGIDVRGVGNANTRVKRQSADVLVAEYLAWLAMGGNINGGCSQTGCGIVDTTMSGKRKRDRFEPSIQTAADRRRWELAKAIVKNMSRYKQ